MVHMNVMVHTGRTESMVHMIHTFMVHTLKRPFHRYFSMVHTILWSIRFGNRLDRRGVRIPLFPHYLPHSPTISHTKKPPQVRVATPGLPEFFSLLQIS